MLQQAADRNVSLTWKGPAFMDCRSYQHPFSALLLLHGQGNRTFLLHKQHVRLSARRIWPGKDHYPQRLEFVKSL